MNFAELKQKESIKEKEGETDVIFKELMEIKDDKAMGIHKTVWGYIDTWVEEPVKEWKTKGS